MKRQNSVSSFSISETSVSSYTTTNTTNFSSVCNQSSLFSTKIKNTEKIIAKKKNLPNKINYSKKHQVTKDYLSDQNFYISSSSDDEKSFFSNNNSCYSKFYKFNTETETSFYQKHLSLCFDSSTKSLPIHYINEINEKDSQFWDSKNITDGSPVPNFITTDKSPKCIYKFSNKVQYKSSCCILI